MFILYDYIHAHDTYIWYLGAVTIEYKRESGGWNNEPMIGATVRIKGQQTGTITDMDGLFSIRLKRKMYSYFRI